MRATRKWFKYTVSGGIVCFTCTLYLLCMMSPPGSHIARKPPDGQGELLQDVQKRHLDDQPRTSTPSTRGKLPDMGRFVNRTSDGRGLVTNLWPKSEESFLEQTQASDDSAKEPACQNDCLRLRNVFDNWPESKPKALIYYLTRANRLDQLKRSLESVEKYFNRVYRYPIVIFHESDLNSFIPMIKQWTNSSIYFQLVTFSLPSFLKKPVKEVILCHSPISYRHMCRFHAKLIYEHPIMHFADFLWRFDDDSLLTKTVPHDVFQFMRDNNLLYGYIWQHLDNYDCVTGLWEGTERYIKQNNIPPNAFPEWRSPKLYYNNFEISSMALWKSQEYRSFIDYIDRLGGIYYHRWGDAPIKGIAASLFVPKHKLHHFKDIGYQHGTFSNP